MKLLCKLCLENVHIIDWDAHISQKQHLQNLPLKIFVKGVAKDQTDELYQYFAQFGGIRSQNVFAGEEIEYRFWDARIYSKIIHQENKFFGKDLEISWARKNQVVQQDETMLNEGSKYLKVAMINSLKQTPSQQIDLFNEHAKLFHEIKQKNKKIIEDDLKCLLSNDFQTSKIMFYGSVITELHVTDGDLNMYLDNTNADLPTLEKILGILQTSDKFSDETLNTSTRSLEFKHSTQTQCKLTVKNEIPVGKTELIKFYLTLDEKLPTFFRLVRFWANCHDLDFSSYTLDLLALFYLQHEPFKLPSISDLQKDLPCDKIDGWNCTFGPVEYSSQRLKSSSIMDIMGGFYHFYVNFDYDTSVITPFCGASVEKSEVEWNSGLCIQDLFEHDLNVSNEVTLSSLGDFQVCCWSCLNQTTLYEILTTKPRACFIFYKKYDIDKVLSKLELVLRQVLLCKFVKNSLVYQCKGNFNVWEGRKTFVNDRTESELVQREIFISSQVKIKCKVWKMRIEVIINEEEEIQLSFDGDFRDVNYLACFVQKRLMSFLNEHEETVIKQDKWKLWIKGLITSPNDKIEIRNYVEARCGQITDQKVELIRKKDYTAWFEFDGNQRTFNETSCIDFRTKFFRFLNTVHKGDNPYATKVDYKQMNEVLSKMYSFPEALSYLKEHLMLDPLKINRILVALNEDLLPALKDTKFEFYGRVANLYGTKIPNDWYINICVVEANWINMEAELRNCKNFSNITLFGNNILFTHTTTRVQCILTENVAELKLSNLIKYYLSLNPHLPTVLIAIEYVVKQHKMLVDNSTEILTVATLLIFYLQQRYEAASVEAYLNGNAEEVDFESETVEVLLYGFFNYYATLDYSYTISVFFGRLIPKNDSKVHVQHPLDPNVNLTEKDDSYRFPVFCQIGNHPKNMFLSNVARGIKKKYTSLVFGISPNPNPKWIKTKKSTILKVLRFAFEARHLTVAEPKPYFCNYGCYVSNFLQEATLESRIEAFEKRQPPPKEDLANCSFFRVKFFSDTGTIRICGEFRSIKHLLFLTLKKYLDEIDDDEEEIEDVTSSKDVKEEENDVVTSTNSKEIKSDEVKLIESDENVEIVEQDVTSSSKLEENQPESVKAESDMEIEESGVTSSQTEETSTYYNQLLTRATETKKDLTETRQLIERHLNSLLSKFSNHKIHFYGSSLTDLETENSTIDIFLENIEDLHSLLPLLNASEFFHDCEMVNARFEAIHCFHGKQKCTITTNLMVIYNSTLLRTFMQMDSKIQQLMLIVKHWAYFHQLEFRNYDLNLLVIFYLQQKCNLPNVHSLQTKFLTVNGWNCDISYVKDRFTISADLCTLLEGFFQFYSNFDYTTNLISTFTGQVLAKTSFLKPFKLDKVYNNYIRTNLEIEPGAGFCIQDPFEHSRNVSLEVPLSSSGKLTGFCRLALQDSVTEMCLSLKGLELDRRQLEAFIFTTLRDVFVANIEKVQVTDKCTRLLCKGYYDVWSQRTKVKKTVETMDDKQLSKKVVRERKINEWTLEIEINFDLLLVQTTEVGYHFLHYVYLNWQSVGSCNSRVLQCLLAEPSFGTLAKCFEMSEDDLQANSKVLSDLKEALGDFGVRGIGSRLTNLLVKGNYLDILVTSSQFVDLSKIRSLASEKFKFRMRNSRLTAQHLESKIFCSIYTDLKYGLSADLVDFYLKANSKVYGLVLAVKLWADRCITNIKVPSFGLFLLLLFYLQQNAYVPATYNLSNFDFAKLEQEDGLRLLLGFFKFYAGFEYRKFVVAPYCGVAMSRAATDEAALCVQNPCDLCENVMARMGGYALTKFVALCRQLENAQDLVSVLFGTCSLNFLLTINEQILPEHNLPASASSSINEQLLFSKELYENTGNFAEQLSILTQDFQRKKIVRNQHLAQLKKDLLSQLKTQIFYFGSTVLNLDLAESNINIYIQWKNGLVNLKNTLSNGGKFTNVTLITHPLLNIPMIRCSHRETQLSCEIHIHASLMVHGTESLNSYLNLDPALRQLLVFLKVFLQTYNINISTYALCLLVVFYLQETYKVESVLSLQTGTTPLLVDGWNCAFNQPKATLQVSVQTLVENFFKMYSQFDYYSYVVSPFYGTCIAKSRFLKPCTLPEPFQKYTVSGHALEVDKVLCVQDVFNHSRNVTLDVSRQDVEKFARFSRLACGKTSLLDLFSLRDKLQFAVERPSNFTVQIWHQVVKSLSMTTLTKVLGCVVRKTCASAEEVSYECQGEYSVFDGRVSALKAVLTRLPRNVGAFDKEAAVTNHLIKAGKKLTQPWNLTLSVSFTDETVFTVSEPDLMHFIYTRLVKFVACESTIDRILPKEKKCEVVVERKVTGPYKVSVITRTKTVKKLNDQISVYTQQILMSFVDLKAKKAVIASDLNQVLHGFSYRNVTFFGSAELGLFSEESTLGIFVEGLPSYVNLAMVRGKLEKSLQFANVSIIGEIVKCLHVKTRLNCDIHVKSRLQVAVSKFFTFYLSTNNKVLNLAKVLKAFCEFNLLDLNISTYAMYLMLIFFLQHQYNFPSVVQLQKDTKIENLDGWNCTFTPQNKLLKLNEPVHTMLIAFFRFYATFDFFSLVVSPFFGTLVQKKDFLEPVSFPNCAGFDVKSPICVQDLFELTRNVTLGSTNQSLGKFTACCRSALKLALAGEKSLLYNLLLTCSLPQNFEPKCFTIRKIEPVDDSDWMQLIQTVFMKILTDFLCCSLVKNEQKSDEVYLKFLAEKDVFENRVQVLKMFSTGSVLDRDVLASRYIFNDVTQERSCSFLEFRLVFAQRPMSVKVQCLNTWHLTHFVYTRMLMLLSEEKGKGDEKLPSEIVAKPYLLLVKGSFGEKAGEVADYFATFGIVTHHKIWHIDKKTLIEVYFASPSSYLKVIQKDHQLFNEKLKLFPLAALWSKIPNAKFANSRLAHIHTTVEYATFDEQLRVFYNSLLTSKVHAETLRQTIGNELANALFFKVNNRRLNFDCDATSIDIESDTLDVNVNVLSDVLVGWKTILTYNEQFSDVSLLPERKNFLLRCRYVKDNIWCFLRLTQPLMLGTNNLINYYVNSHPKIKQAMYFLKFWADSYDLIGCQGFSNQAFQVMVVFYLQQEPIKLLPVRNLLNETNETESNCVFAKTLNPIVDVSVLDILIGFFSFYSTFDYISYVICPFFGIALPKICFMKPFTLPTCYNQYISQENELDINSGICVQDFFEHSKNLSLGVPVQSCGFFTSLCRNTLQIIQPSEKLLLYKILLCCHDEYPTFVVTKPDQKPSDEWFKDVKQFIGQLLMLALKFTVTELPVNEPDTVTFSCIGSYNVWANRMASWKNIYKNLTGLSGLFKEIQISKQSEMLMSTICSMLVELTFLKDPVRLKVTFIKKCGEFEFLHICQFVYTRVLKFLKGDRENELAYLPKPALVLEPVSPEVKKKKKRCQLEEGEVSDASVDFSDDDDVPSDFFDDFAKDGFLDDIVEDLEFVEEEKVQKRKRKKSKESPKKKRKMHLEVPSPPVIHNLPDYTKTIEPCVASSVLSNSSSNAVVVPCSAEVSAMPSAFLPLASKKVFIDRKISEDFAAIWNNKGSPKELKRKVLSRCDKVTKLLTVKQNTRFLLKKNVQTKKHTSPLKVHFKYTTPRIEDIYNSALKDLVQVLKDSKQDDEVGDVVETVFKTFIREKCDDQYKVSRTLFDVLCNESKNSDVNVGTQCNR